MRELLVKTIGKAGDWAFVLFLGFLVATVFGIWLLSADARQQIDETSTAPGDNLQWTLAQLDVEYGAMRLAATAEGVEEPSGLRDLRRKFDILYSRFTILKSAPAFEPVRSDPGVSEAMARISAFLQEFVPLIDGTDRELVSGLPEFLKHAEQIGPDVRMTTLVGMKVYTASSETKRELAAAALFDLAMLILFLVLLLLGLVVVLAYVLTVTRSQTEEIEQTRSRLGSIVGTSLDAVVVVNRQNRIVEFNAAAERIFGYGRGEAMGADMAELIIPPDQRDAHSSGLKRHLQTGAKRMIDGGLIHLQAMRKGGEVFPVEVSISTARSAEGTIYISFVRDISVRVASEQELVEARDRAVSGEQAKSDLLAIMSHEMRTPLNGILGTLDLLGSSDLNDHQRQFVEVMETSGKMLLRHVNDVLDVSRMDAEIPVPVRAPFDLGGLAHAVIEGLKSQADARNNKLSLITLGPASRLVIGDRGRIEQVLVNLVGNACKFTRDGSITIEVETIPGGDFVELRVIDTGVGIPEDDLERIFDDFVTLDSRYSRLSGGTGLGLGIARRLVAALEGEIGVESDVGQGSVFWVRLPLPPAGAEASETPAEQLAILPDAQGRKVLLVEDNEINRLVAREMLVRKGCVVAEAVDGAEGVALAERTAFDLVLMDISMPRLDGVMAARAIKDGGGPNRTTPIVALTAHALPEDILRFRDAGFADVLVKPLSRDRLAAVLAARFGALQHPGDGAGDLEATLGGEAAARIRAKALTEIASGLDDMGARLRAGVPPADLTDAAHRLIGLAGLVGLSDLHDTMSRLHAALGRPDATGLQAMIADMRGLITDVRDVA